MQSAMNSSMVVLLPLFLGVSLSVALLGGWIALGRLPKKDYVLHRPISFLITDIYVLLMEMSLAALLVRFGAPILVPEEFASIMVAVWIYVILFWYLGVRRLSRRGATMRWRRAVYLIFAAPFAYGWLLCVPAILFFPAASVKQSSGGASRVENTMGEIWLPFLFLGVLAYGLLMIFFGCRAMERWAASGVDHTCEVNAI